MKILLTGANGQVGREIVDLAPPDIQLFAFPKAELDITSLRQLKESVYLHQPDLIINTAAYTAVDKAEQEVEPAFAVNSEGVKNLALICKEYNLPLIHLSTDYVFNGEKEHAYVEDDPRSPLNVYGASKAEGEKLLQDIWHKHIILRVSWVFGRYGHNFVKTILRLAAEREELHIVADQYGFPTAAKDLAATLFLLAEHVLHKTPSWGIFHYRGDKPVSWFDFANIVLEHGEGFDLRCQKIHPITAEDFPTPAKRPKNSLLAMEKIQEWYGITPGDWEKRLVEMLRQMNSEMNKIT